MDLNGGHSQCLCSGQSLVLPVLLYHHYHLDGGLLDTNRRPVGVSANNESLSFVNFQSLVCGVSLRVSAVGVWVKGRR